MYSNRAHCHRDNPLRILQVFLVLHYFSGEVVLRDLCWLYQAAQFRLLAHFRLVEYVSLNNL